MKDKYVYPAIFKYEDDNISISFPDFEGCFSCANSDEEALYMAKDALACWLLTLEEENESIPEPSKLKDIELTSNQNVVLIETNLALHREPRLNRSVKKTLTIPQWLNIEAEKNNINFSSLLQEALKDRLFR